METTRGRPHRPPRSYDITPVISQYPNITVAARALGVSRSVLYKYLRRGATALDADRLAVRSGFHPFELWPDQWMRGE